MPTRDEGVHAASSRGEALVTLVLIVLALPMAPLAYFAAAFVSMDVARSPALYLFAIIPPALLVLSVIAGVVALARQARAVWWVAGGMLAALAAWFVLGSLL